MGNFELTPMNKLLEHILDSGEPSAQELAEALERWPYFVYPVMRALEAETSPEKRRRLKERIAACVGSTEALARIFGEEPEEFIHFYPDERKPELTTEDTIEQFIGRFGHASDAYAVAEAEESVPVAAPAVDYAAMLEASEETPAADMPADATSSMLDSFLGAHPAPVPHTRPQPQPEPQPAAAPEPEPDSEPYPAAVADRKPPLSQSLARIMIKNRNYEKALEIITALSLNNPEKSIYFADQIRFLRKLIVNEERKKTEKAASPADVD